MESCTNYGSYSLEESELFNTITAPYNDAPDTTTWWYCSQCKPPREVNLAVYGTTCPDCPHEKCSSCTTTEHPTTPFKQAEFNLEESTRNDSHFQGAATGYHTHPHSDQGHGDFTHPSRSHDKYTLPVGDLPGAGCENGRRPSMEGWWECCECHSEINSALNGKDCPYDGHVYDRYCCKNLGKREIH